jgi:hypothetical protein
MLAAQRTAAAAEALGAMLEDEDENIQRQALMRLQQMRIPESLKIVTEYRNQQAEKAKADKEKAEQGDDQSDK